MNTPKCTICGDADATQKNSHLIPSFIVSKICSYDGSGKRGKEIMITMSSYQDRVYLGEIPSTKIEDLFDTEQLTDERINDELKVNTVTKDYIFCPKCEAKLSRYLESPYAEAMKKDRSVDKSIAYFFWVSIVWRMSISNQFEFSLPNEIETILGQRLNDYFNAVEKGGDIEAVIARCPFSYKLIHCPTYLPENAAYIYATYRMDDKILSLTLGDIVLCAKFDNYGLPDNFTYLGLEEHLLNAPLNKGTETEQKIVVDTEVFKQAKDHMVQNLAKKKILNEKELADMIWKVVGLTGEMPNDIFISLMEKWHSEDVKLGDRKTKERYVKLFNQTLEEFGYIGV